MYRIQITVIVSAHSQADALKLLQDRVEPNPKERASNGMYVEAVDRIEDAERKRR